MQKLDHDAVNQKSQLSKNTKVVLYVLGLSLKDTKANQDAWKFENLHLSQIHSDFFFFF